jgi:hypothetical protein
MRINDPATHAALTAAFARYEAALVGNDVATLTELFWDSPHSIRYGAGECLYGSAEIAAFRAARSPAGLARRLLRTVITTYGEACGTTSTLFRRDSAPGRLGRQMQTWVRIDGAWRIVAAHVSLIDDAPA